MSLSEHATKKYCCYDHDRSLEAAMTGAFVIGPLMTVVGLLTGLALRDWGDDRPRHLPFHDRSAAGPVSSIGDSSGIRQQRFERAILSREPVSAAGKHQIPMERTSTLEAAA